MPPIPQRPGREPVVTGKPIGGGPAANQPRFQVFEGQPTRRWPFDIGLPDDVLEGLPFLALDADVPLLLLPIRLETRYRLDADPPELRIRIFPDQVHIDADTPEPAAAETDLAVEFWSRWHAAADDAGRRAAWRRFAGRAGAGRAAYLARRLQPKVAPGGRLDFPKQPPRGPRSPARPVLLPRQWLAIGFMGDQQLFQVASLPVDPNLRTGPDSAAPAWQVADSGLVIDDGLAWMVDYGRAVDAGMAITVPLTGAAAPAAHDNLTVLLVVGVNHELDADASKTELARLLDVHARTTGLAFVPQGTPTNNTETVTSGWTAAAEEPPPPDLPERLSKPLPGEPEGKPVPGGQGDNAKRLADALGLGNPASLRLLPLGDDTEFGRSKSMREAIFEAVLGTLARDLLDVGDDNAVSPAVVNTLRSWFVDQVTGGAQVPALRVGAQPYGILPVRRSTSRPLSTTADWVEWMVSSLITTWRLSWEQVPTLNSDLGDAGGDDAVEGEHEATVATILATQPHPARLFVRGVTDYDALTEEEQWETLRFDYELFLAAAADGMGVDSLEVVGAEYLDMLEQEYPDGGEAAIESIDAQIDLWTMVDDEIVNQHGGFEDAREYVGYAQAILGAYEARQRPLRFSWLGLDRFEGVLGQRNTKLVQAELHETAVEWGEVGLVQAPDAGPGRTAADYLADLEARFAEREGVGSELPPSSTLPDAFLADPPLLYQLLERTLPLVPAVAEQRVLDALGDLAGVDPVTLEWLLRETLGLGAHRLDAWATSVAAERLDRLRQARPEGIQVGAFGWVTDLLPRQQPRLSQGFVHAPSMAHATTAALLRSGWHAHGTDDPSSAAAVDLRSDRVRTATWLLDGVRAGQPLGDLLGYRFERALHDLGAAGEIFDIRRQVLDATDRPDVAPDQPVDGIELLELARAEQLTEITETVQLALDDLESTFDAVDDTALFEAVHQLAVGNGERATAILDAVSLGLRTPPELRAPHTPRAGSSVEHRVVVLLDPDATPPQRGWSAGIRDAISPALDAWVASLLPRADAVGFAVTGTGEAGGAGGRPRGTVPMTLAELALSALDAVYLIGDDPTQTAPALRTLAAGAAGSAGPVEIDPGAATAGQVTLTEFAVLAIELRRTVASLRAADARDLRPAHTAGEPGSDPAAALDAAETLLADTDRLRDDLNEALQDGRTDDLAAAVERFARLGISLGASPTDATAGAALERLGDRRMAAVTAVAVDPDDRQPGLEGRLAVLLGARVPILGRFTLVAADGGEVVDLSTGLVGAAEVDDWLDAAGRVRADVGRLTTVAMLSELLTADGGLRLSAGQAPLLDGDPWSATARPTRGARLSVAAVTGPGGPPRVGAAACGLVVDRWAERIPQPDQVTGLAFQFDAPSTKPPQAWLLAVTPDGEPWSLKLVVDTLLETLEWAMLRAVGPEDLVDYGRSVPTTFVPGSITPWSEAP